MVISSCSSSKAVNVDEPLTLEDFQDPERRHRRELELQTYMRPAGAMYSGRQHLALMRGVAKIRERFGPEAVAVQIISAGYGLISEQQLIAPYNATFRGMPRRMASSWALFLGIADAVRNTIRDWRLVIFLLGEAYLTSVDPPIAASTSEQRLIFIAKPILAPRLSASGVILIPAGRAEEVRFGDRYALKGRLFELYARRLCHEGSLLWENTCADPTAATFSRAIQRELEFEQTRWS